MDLSYNDEQRLLKDSVDKFLQQEYDFESRRRIAQGDEGFDKNHWRTFAELGWLAIPFTEEQGGLNGGPVETMIMMEAFGKALVLEPWLSTVLMSGQLLASLAPDEQKTAWLNAIIQGELLCSVAHWEPQRRFDLAPAVTTAKRHGEGYVLQGQKQFVLQGQTADRFLVSAHLGADSDEAADTVALFMVDPTLPGVDITAFRTLENGRASHVDFNQVALDANALIAKGENALVALQDMEAQATFAVCCEAVGIMEKLYKTTVEYTKTRKQFGLPIGKFQALQHRMVNMFILHEQSSSLMLLTAIKLQEGGEAARLAVSGFKAWIGQAGRKLGQEAIQIHGGMGMTDELDVGYYFKRLTAIDALFGNADYHLGVRAKALS